MGKNVFVFGTLDTKGPEFIYLRDKLKDLGLNPTVADVGILDPPLEIEPDYTHADVAKAGGTTIEALQNAGTRGKAVDGMRAAIKQLTLDLFNQGKIDGVISMGGAEGAVMGAEAMMQLPVGFPKVLLSPIASGKHYFGPLVGTSDMMVIHTVVDILGLNPIACTIFDNAAAALKGMIEDGSRLPEPEAGQRYVAITMLGNTTKAVMAMKKRLAREGYEGVIFHANGVGGPAMEELAALNQFVGVIDYTNNEVNVPHSSEGSVHNGGPDRLKRVSQLGIPQVIVPGCVDFSVFHAGAIPPELKDQPVYDHNPEYTLVRTSKEDMVELGKIFAERIGTGKGPVRIAVPTRGLSIPNHPEGVFWDPEGDKAFLDSLRKELTKRRSDIPVETFEYHINDPAFGEIIAEYFISLMKEEIKH